MKLLNQYIPLNFTIYLKIIYLLNPEYNPLKIQSWTFFFPKVVLPLASDFLKVLYSEGARFQRVHNAI